MEERMS